MNRLHSMLSWLVVCPFALGACASTAPMSAEPALPPLRTDTIARLMVDGPNAYINRQPVRGGSYVFDGDTVSTGPATSAKLILNEGGEIQLDENTDPLFKQGACLLMKILRGRVAFHNMKCQEFEDGLKMAGVARSYVHIESREDASRVTVLVGEVEMRSPSPAILGMDAEYVATREGAVEVLQLTPEEANARIAWTRNFFRPRATQESGGVSSGEAAAIGAGLGALLDFLGRGRRTPAPQEPGQRGRTQQETPAQPAATPPRGNQTVPAPIDRRIPENQNPPVGR
jgi:hypothetical protein